ncbi:RNA-binding protein 33-like isoform X2 [Myxocyprinus asiaticus]|uniref:RNA-binding protein 33-like isoform X2 n=1 Tax=Myxocyprinus asiaticus TaxID=70543 RepID=UPI002223B4F6|nr:RNA-binding protein 33-like isoform X2 [Myxocyprinus asiaticus]
MATNAGDDEFDEYDKPGAERSRRRRGEDDDDLESDLEEDLLEEDWLSSKKNPSELSDEELNDDLLQSDEEDQNASGQGEVLSLNATLGLDTSGHLQDEDPKGGQYTEEAYEETEAGQEGFAHDGQYEGVEYQGADEGVEYTGEQNYDGYQDEVLDLQIDEPLDDDFQVDDYLADYSEVQQEEQTDQHEVAEEHEETEDSSQVTELEEAENDPEAEPDQDMDVKEESDEEEEDVEESGRLRFKTERTDATVVRLSDATSKRRNIPETLELSEEAKADLQQFEEKERQRKQGCFGGRGRGGPRTNGGRGGLAGRGWVRGRGGRGGGGRCEFPPFGMGNLRGDGVGGRGRINEQRPPLMQMNLGMQLRMTSPLQHHHQSRLQDQRGAGGPGLFPEPGAPISQQPLQLLMPHLAHRSPGPSPRAQHGTHGLRMLSSPPRHAPPHPSQHQQHQQHHPKNIHINPHFRGPSSSPVQVSSMPPVQPRPNITPQRLPAPPDFQQHLHENFGPPQRPLPPQEQWRGPPPRHQDREHFFTGEPHFPGQHLFDQTGPPPLMNNSVLPMSGQGPPPFPPQGGLGGSGFGSLGLGQSQGPQGGGVFQREPPRPSMAPLHAGPPGPPGPCGFVGHRQPFSPQQQGPPFSSQNMPFGMQVRQRGLMQQHSQPLHHDPPLSHLPLHQQQHEQHRQDLPPQGLPHSQPLPQHHQHHQHHPRDQHPTMHLSQPHFRQPFQIGHRPMQSRQQGIQQRNNPPRPRMTSPSPLQQIPPQRNSNLRELPIATGNNNISASVPGGQTKPVTRAIQNAKPGQPARAGPAGRGGPVAQRQGAAKVLQQPSAPQMKKEQPAAQSSTTPEDPDEDEETRQYRLKIEEQKRLREEILKRKEISRQLQAGVRKKELMERISGQSKNQASQTPNPTQPPVAQRSSQPPQQVPSLVSNGTTQNPASGLSTPHQNVKTRLQNTKPQTLALGWSGAQPQGQRQLQQKRNMNPQNAQGPGTIQSNPAGGHSLGQPQSGGKRTVMQRTNSLESPQVPQKVRVVKLSGEADAGPNTGAPPQPQHQQQSIGRPAPQQRLGPIRKVTMTTGAVQNQQAGRGMANQTNRVFATSFPFYPIAFVLKTREGGVMRRSRVLVTNIHPKGAAAAIRQGTEEPGRLKAEERPPTARGGGAPYRLLKRGGVKDNTTIRERGGAHCRPSGIQCTYSTQSYILIFQKTKNQLNDWLVTLLSGRRRREADFLVQVVVRGRGRGGGRAMMQQNPRAQDGQRTSVCIEGLSTTTTDKQLMSLLNSIGPIEMFTMFPEQQKAIAKFVNPQHAESFQHSFHRHMIDLSHIDVSIIDG